MLDYWNDGIDADDENCLHDYGISLMTYDRLIALLLQGASASTGAGAGADKEVEQLKNLKVVVFDECHTLFSDTFIKDIDMVIQWTLDNLYSEKRYYIGLTATPGIVEYNSARFGNRINRMNGELITQYKAKQLVCTNFNTIPYLISANRLKGKTMILCVSVADCLKLQRRLKNAAVVISPHADEYSPAMDEVRNYIVEYESLPDEFDYPIRNAKGEITLYERRKLDVLITTSTLREGVNLREESGVRNVICCFTDELHVTQFAGRCRYNLDTLVVASSYVKNDNLKYVKSSEYLIDSRKAFNDYWKNNARMAWYLSIAHLVDHTMYDVKRFVMSADDIGFINYINERWLVPKGAVSKKDIQHYRICTDEQKEEIRQMAIECNLFSDIKPSRLTFNRIIGVLINDLGYEVESGRTIATTSGERETYKLIVNFEGEKVDYERTYQEF